MARRGRFTQALIYYHFADLQALLVAALERASTERLARYREVLAGVDSVAGLAAALGDLYLEDVAVGHVKAVQEIVGGAGSSPDLGRQGHDRVQVLRIDVFQPARDQELGFGLLE